MLPVCRTPDDVYAIPPFEVTCKDVEGFLDERGEFHALFLDCFVRRDLGCLNRALTIDRFLDSGCQNPLSFAL